MSAQRRLILIVASILFAVPPVPAQAKGLAKATVCGADGCTSITERARGARGCPNCGAEQLLTALPGSAHPSRRAPYVRIGLGFGHPGGAVEGRERILFAPELGLSARTDHEAGWAWFRLSPQALAVARRLTRGIQPYPAASMPLGRPALTGTFEPKPAAPAASEEAGGLPILPAGPILVAVLALAAFAVRRRRHTAAGARAGAAAG